MSRLTNDNSQDNMGQALNLFYAKDGETWVRNGGEGPDYADISLYNLVRLIAREHPDIGVPSGSDDEIGDVMCDLLMDGTETIAGIVALLYTAGWAFAELRARLKKYEDILFDIDDHERISFAHLAEICAAEKDGRYVVLPKHDNIPAKLKAINTLEVDDFDCDCGEVGYVYAESSLENIKILFDAGFTTHEIGTAIGDNDGVIDLSVLAFRFCGAASWDSGGGFSLGSEQAGKGEAE